MYDNDSLAQGLEEALNQSIKITNEKYRSQQTPNVAKELEQTILERVTTYTEEKYRNTPSLEVKKELEEVLKIMSAMEGEKFAGYDLNNDFSLKILSRYINTLIEILSNRGDL